MATAGRNAPCPCGSGQKLKRCCATGSRDRNADVHREERVGRNAEKWAFKWFGDELVAAGRQLTARLRRSSQATWIVEHWVMLDYELDEGGTAAGRYAQMPGLTATDREIATRIARSRPGVHRVIASRAGESIDLVDVLCDAEITVTSADVSRQATAGSFLVARVMPGPSPSLWGPAGVFGARQGHVLLDEVHRLTGPDLEHALRQAWPMLITHDTSQPRLVARVEWDLDDPDAVFDLLPETLEYDAAQDGADVFLWRIGDRPGDYGGFFELYRDGLIAWTYAQSLVDQTITLIDDAVGPLTRLVRQESVAVPPARTRVGLRRRAA